MAVTIDPRPTVFGDRMIVTGSYEAGDTEIDLGSQLVKIDAFIINPAGLNAASINGAIDPANGTAYTTGQLQGFDYGRVADNTTILLITPVKLQTTKAGTFLAIGRRS